MREIRTSGLTSGVGNRDGALRQHPRPTSTLPTLFSVCDMLPRPDDILTAAPDILYFKDGRAACAYERWNNGRIPSIGSNPERSARIPKFAAVLSIRRPAPIWIQ